MKCARCHQDKDDSQFKHGRKRCEGCVAYMSKYQKSRRGRNPKNGKIVCSRCNLDKDSSEFSNSCNFGHSTKKVCDRCLGQRSEFYSEHVESERSRCREGQAKRRIKSRDYVNRLKREGLRRNPATYMYQRAKNRAKTLGLQFNLEHEDVVVPEVCPILGIPLHVSDGKCSANSPSIDRIDSSRGYIKGNIQVISHKANTIKSNATLGELEMVVKFMSEFK